MAFGFEQGTEEVLVDIVILYDESPSWQYPVLGLNIAQHVLNACCDFIGTQRVFVSTPINWAIGVSGKRQIIEFPIGSAKITQFWNEFTQEQQLIKIFRSSNIQEAIVLTSSTMYVWPFMLAEVFEKANNSVLFSTKWSDIIKGNLVLPKIELENNSETLIDVYSEMANGASWEDIMEDYNGKQDTIL